ncbi:MAG: hypothetical protein IPL88_09485 [Rhizobiales bacterium]|nr:hypothetical protein [Hyphomicrobiales bacterium]
MKRLVVAAFAATLSFAASAQMREPGTGPVAEHCQGDIERLCANLTHGNPAGGQRGAIRPCLEQNIAQVSPACRTALQTTGPGRRR